MFLVAMHMPIRGTAFLCIVMACGHPCPHHRGEMCLDALRAILPGLSCQRHAITSCEGRPKREGPGLLGQNCNSWIWSWSYLR